MKPDKFDGKGSYETFLYQFENCARYNEWDMTDKVAHLRWSLTGIAAQLLWEPKTHRRIVIGETEESIRRTRHGREVSE